MRQVTFIAPDDIPFPRAGTASTDSAGAAIVTIFLAHASHLAPVKRQVSTTSVADRLDALVVPTEDGTLSEAPIDREAFRGLVAQ